MKLFLKASLDTFFQFQDITRACRKVVFSQNKRKNITSVWFLLVCMGATISSLLSTVHEATQEHHQTKLFVCGLDGAGRVSILNHLRFGPDAKKRQEFPFQNLSVVDVVECPQLKISSIYLGLRWTSILIDFYVRQADAIIFVVDSADHSRIDETREELHDAIKGRDDQPTNRPSRNIPLLIFANKQDLPNAYSPTKIQELLRVDQLFASYGQRSCFVQGTSAAEGGQGIREGLRWLSQNLPNPLPQQICI